MKKGQNNKAPKRTDSRGRILHENEMQRTDGRYMYTIIDPITKERRYIYSWKLERHDPVPAGKKNDKSLREKIKELQAKEFIKISLNGGGLTVLELVDRYINTRRNVRPSTKAGYKTVQNFLKDDAFGKRRIDTVNTLEAKEWLIKLQDVDKKSYSSIHSIRGVIKPAFQLAVESNLIFANPFAFELKGVLINDSIQREAISPRDERRFLEFIRTDGHFSRYYNGILILFKTGMRLGELCGLTIEDIDLENKVINISKQLQYNSGVGKNVRETKTKSGARTLPMSDEVYDAFVSAIQNRTKPSKEETVDGYTNFVFLDDRGKVMVGYQWEKRFYYILEKYNKTFKDELPKITPHVCRHTYCTRMAASGISMQTLSYLMGHSSIEITNDVYTHLNADTVRSEMKKAQAEIKKLDKKADKVISMPRMA